MIPRHPRYEVSLWAIERGAGTAYYHRVRNMSASGLFLDKPVPLPMGEHFPLELPLPSVGSVKAYGIVVRAAEDGNGVAMVGLEDDDRALLEEYLATLASVH